MRTGQEPSLAPSVISENVDISMIGRGLQGMLAYLKVEAFKLSENRNNYYGPHPINRVKTAGLAIISAAAGGTDAGIYFSRSDEELTKTLVVILIVLLLVTGGAGALFLEPLLRKLWLQCETVVVAEDSLTQQIVRNLESLCLTIEMLPFEQQSQVLPLSQASILPLRGTRGEISSALSRLLVRANACIGKLEQMTGSANLATLIAHAGAITPYASLDPLASLSSQTGPRLSGNLQLSVFSGDAQQPPGVAALDVSGSSSVSLQT